MSHSRAWERILAAALAACLAPALVAAAPPPASGVVDRASDAPAAARIAGLALDQTEPPIDDGTEPPPPTPPRRRLATIWSKPGAATAIVLGAAVIVGIAVDQLSDDEPAASPF